jgi:hypothetical protein
MSGAPEDSNANSPPSGISRGDSAIIHRTVRYTPDSVRCAKGGRPQELASFGKLQRLVRYNSPDCPVYTGLSGATPEQWLVGANGYLRRNKCARSARRSQARPYWHTGQGTVAVRCAPDTQAGPQVRSSNGQNPTAVMTWQGAPDYPVCTGLSGVHRTVRCNSGATANSRQRLPAAHLMRALRAQKAGAPILAHRTANSTYPVCTGHPGGPTSQKL